MHLVLYIRESFIEANFYNQKDYPKTNRLDWNQVNAFLADLPKSCRLTVILDTSEETIHTDYVPVLLPWEKYSLEKRLIEKNKQKGTLTQRVIWTGLKRKNGERKEELIVSLNIAPLAQFKELVSSIEKNQLLWIGFFSVSALLRNYLFSKVKSQQNLTSQQLKQPLLMFARIDKNHYRQCFFNNGFLELARLVLYEVDEKSILQQQDFLVNEAKLASRFIYNQGLLERSKPISYIIIGSMNKDLEGLIVDKFFNDNLLISNKSDSNQYLITHNPLSENNTGELSSILIENVAKIFQPSFYWLPYIWVSNGFHYARKLILFLVFCMFLILGMVGINGGINTYFIGQKAELLSKTEAILQNKKVVLLEQAKGRESVIDVESINKFSVELNLLNEKEPYGIHFEVLSRVLNNHPNINIDELTWEPLSSIDSNTMTVSVRGKVIGFQGRYQPINELVELFRKDLEQVSGLEEVKITQLPYNQEQARNFRLTRTVGTQGLMFSMSWTQSRSLPMSIRKDNLP